MHAMAAIAAMAAVLVAARQRRQPRRPRERHRAYLRVVRNNLNARMGVGCQTGCQTAISAQRPFLGLFPPEFLWLKALEALSNFPAACQVVGGKAQVAAAR